MVVVPVAAVLIVDPVGSGVAVVAGTAVAVPEPSDVGELVVLCVAGALVAGAVGLPVLGVPGAPEPPGPVVVFVPVMSKDVMTLSCPVFSVHGTLILSG